MIFEVFTDKNIRLFVTEYESCIPTIEIQKSLISNGYKIRVDNKLIKSPYKTIKPTHKE